MTQAIPVPQPPSNRIPAEIRCAQDYELAAQRRMAAPSYAYVAGGSARGLATAANTAAFSAWSILPRVLCDVSGGQTGLTLGDLSLPHPILLAPVAFQKLAHEAGEIATARAAEATDTCMVCSTLASSPLADIAQAAGQRKWFQLYFQASRADTLALLQQAERAGFTAIVVTLDAAIQVAGFAALDAGFRMPDDCVAVNLPAPAHPVRALAQDASAIFQGAMHGAPTWDDLAWLQQQTALPVWVKGVLHPDDARLLKQAGIAGVVVSNHGGRGLDGAPASLAMLPAVRAAVGPDFPLLFDGGIRSGADVFKALALGADAVLVGRLQLYALSVAGPLGVAHMIKLLREELEVCMALSGCTRLDQIDSSRLLRQA